MRWFGGSAAAVLGLTIGMTHEAEAQASCQQSLPAFTAAMRAGTTEALTTYLTDHGPCFEAPARARLDLLAAAAQPVAQTEPPPPVEVAAPAQPIAPSEPVASTETAAPAQTDGAKPALTAAPLPNVADPSCTQYAQARSERWDQPLDMRITNRTNMTLSVAWINYEGQRQLAGTMAPGDIFGGGTFVTHPFELTGPDGACVTIIMPQVGTLDYSVGP